MNTGPDVQNKIVEHHKIESGCKKRVKGDLLYKNHFYKVFEHSCVAAMCENNQPIMVKIHPIIYL